MNENEVNNYPVPLAGAKHDTLMWAYEHEIEPQAAQQIRNVAALPWVHGVRVMPDCHLGVGATIGTVIASEQAISPSAVGVDLGCVDKDSEYLTRYGWRKISGYREGLEIMQYDPETKTGSFVVPSRYIKQPQSEFLHFKTKYGIDQMLSRKHKVLAYKITGRDRRRIPVVLSAQELAEIHNSHALGARYEFETAFTPIFGVSEGIDLTDDQIRLQIAFNADGHKPDRHFTRMEQGVTAFKKPRKIERMRYLLDVTGTEYTEHDSSEGVTIFRFHPPRMKGYGSFWWEADNHQLEVIAEEVLLWDGDSVSKVFSTSNRDSADFIHYVFAATGHRSVLREDPSRSVTGLPEYRVFRIDESRTGLSGSPKSEIKVVPSEDGFEYCFTVPSGFWVMRRNGNIVMTGNCGVNVVKTSLTLEDVHDSLHKVRSDIEAAVPVGFNSHEKNVSSGMKGDKAFWSRFKDLQAPVQNLESRALHQLGTLGGGNHFIELCTDSKDQIWITLHSGSRNIGKELAERHINIAKTLPQNQDLPDLNLAVFLRDTPEMLAYRHDLEWAQEFAMRSRSMMMSLVKEVVQKEFGTHSVKFSEEINCHHNYVAEEEIDGRMMLVTRKGAIRAGLGDMALIPGSMGTGSYIVRGLGNTDSYQSASHGAGRRMSRGAAKRAFTGEDSGAAQILAQLGDIESRRDAGILDELPLAYKDIHSVISAQSNLVEPVEHLQTILCVKG